MARTREFWAHFRKTFNPAEILAGERQTFYETRTYDPLDELELLFSPTESLNRPPTVFLSGHRGSGKSSLIFRLLESVGQDYFVVYTDIEYCLDLNTANAADIAYLIGGAVFITAQREQLEPDIERLQDLEKALATLLSEEAQKRQKERTESVLDRLRGLVVLGATALGFGAATNMVDTDLSKAAGIAVAGATIGEKLANASRQSNRVTSQVEDSQVYRRELQPQLLEINRCVNAILDDVQSRAEKPILLILDGFEKIPGVDQAERIFLDSPVLRGPQCATLYTVPLPIYLKPRFVENTRDCTIAFVPNVKLFERNDTDQTYEPGYEQMAHLAQRRLQSLSETDVIVQPEVIRLATRFSGGHLRDFIRIFERASLKAQIAKAEQVLEEHVTDAVLDMIADMTLTLTRELKEELRQIEKTNDPSRSDESQQLLHSHYILAYRNREHGTWYAVHPLLWEAL